MRPANIWQIGRLTLCEWTRKKVFYMFFIVALAFFGLAFTLNFFNLGPQARFTMDLSLTAMGLFTAILSLGLSLSAIPQDLENKTAWCLLSRPVSRFDYLCGKFLGTVLLILIILSILTVELVVVTFLKENRLHWTILQAGLLLWVESLVLTAVVLTFSLPFSPPMNAAFSSFVYAVGHLSSTYIQALSQESRNVAGGIPVLLLKLALPQLQYFDLKSAVVQGYPVPLGYTGEAVLYGLLYALMVLLLGELLLSRKDL
ncbi:MAG: ABC transporter permease subunit [Armatimonadetes bacterium]|nr:ABC transporter permease subunit [Armatimonadota bacterium]